MDELSKTNRYIPHLIQTRINAVKLYRSCTKNRIEFVCRRYKISKASLMRWNKRYDGTVESLMDKSHRPKTPHPKAQTEEELHLIKKTIKYNPDLCFYEYYTLLKQAGYTRCITSLYRAMCRLGLRDSKKPATKKNLHNQKYHTPKQLGVKWQLDVKFVPTICNKSDLKETFYQYTIIDEASRKRYIYIYMEHSSYSSCDFLRRAINFFGYKPQILQTDNGAEFTHIRQTERVHPLDLLCQKIEITHKLIRPRTPWHNGKVERSHRNDQNRFYSSLSFSSFEELQESAEAYLKRSNNIISRAIGGLSPNDKHEELLKEFSPSRFYIEEENIMKFINENNA